MIKFLKTGLAGLFLALTFSSAFAQFSNVGPPGYAEANSNPDNAWTVVVLPSGYVCALGGYCVAGSSVDDFNRFVDSWKFLDGTLNMYPDGSIPFWSDPALIAEYKQYLSASQFADAGGFAGALNSVAIPTCGPSGYCLDLSKVVYPISSDTGTLAVLLAVSAIMLSAVLVLLGIRAVRTAVK
ncbi:hypothetical protein [Ralstonia sp. RRA.1]|uniref:hypothetical protein n=1 Tax=Ralstonia sp. RRA TaxID=3122075 RepID=UPI0030D0DA4E